MSDDELHDLVERLHAAASDGLARDNENGLTTFLGAQLANEAALAINELTATRTLLLAGPSNWLHMVDLARRH